MTKYAKAVENFFQSHINNLKTPTYGRKVRKYIIKDID